MWENNEQISSYGPFIPANFSHMRSMFGCAAPNRSKGRIVERGKRPLHLSTVKREMSDTEEEVSMRDMEKREEGEKASLVRDPVRPAATLRQAAILPPSLSAGGGSGR